jgi:hypothetical protein
MKRSNVAVKAASRSSTTTANDFAETFPHRGLIDDAGTGRV